MIRFSKHKKDSLLKNKKSNRTISLKLLFLLLVLFGYSNSFCTIRHDRGAKQVTKADPSAASTSSNNSNTSEPSADYLEFRKEFDEFHRLSRLPLSEFNKYWSSSYEQDVTQEYFQAGVGESAYDENVVSTEQFDQVKNIRNNHELNIVAGVCFGILIAIGIVCVTILTAILGKEKRFEDVSKK